jgi:methionyl-tRNA formyltransferase
MTRLRIVFMGTPPLAASILDALLKDDTFEVIGVVTQPDQPKGRDLKLQPSAVKEFAQPKGLLILQPKRARDPEFIEQIRLLAPDLIVVAAFGQILPQSLLDVPRHGCLNVHTSLLPKYRGAAPIQWAIINGEAETGVSIMQMDAGLDTGAIVSIEATPIRDSDTAATLHDRLAAIGGGLLVRTIPGFVSGTLKPHAQPDAATYARKIQKEDGRIDWTQSARTIWNRLRGLTPWPGTFTRLIRLPSPVLLKIVRAEVVHASGNPGTIIRADREGIIVSCGTEGFRILELQREGGKRLNAREFLAGFPIKAGETFE